MMPPALATVDSLRRWRHRGVAPERQAVVQVDRSESAGQEREVR